MSGGIFISYRREDSAGFAGRIYDRIASRLDRELVFFDVDNINLGVDFVRALSEQVAECDALVAIIGKQWLAATDEENRRRWTIPKTLCASRLRPPCSATFQSFRSSWAARLCPGRKACRRR